jgi:hypothetical protein
MYHTMNPMLEKYLLEMSDKKKSALLNDLKTDGSPSYFAVKALFEKAKPANCETR